MQIRNFECEDHGFKNVKFVDVGVPFDDRNHILESEIDAENMCGDKVNDVTINYDECVIVVDVLFVVDWLDVLTVDDDVPNIV